MENSPDNCDVPESAGQPERPALLELNASLVDSISALVEDQHQSAILGILVDLHPADLAQLLHRLPIDEAKQVFRWLPDENAGEALSELEDDYRAELMDEAPQERLTAMLDELESDDAADVLADLPEHVAREVLSSLEDADEVEELLGHHEETAGGLMAAEYISVPATWTVEQATEEVRRKAPSVERIFLLYVLDDDKKLVGRVSLTRLLLSPADAQMGEIMKHDVISVPTATDQEEVARIMERYDLVSLPVVNQTGQLVGRITIDDVVDVLREEAEEDMQRMSGVSGREEATDSVWRIVSGRLPWLLLGLLGASFAALIIGLFEESLKQATVLAAFIPIVMATAGNAGIQSSAIAVQGLASGDVWSSDLFKRLGKEIIVAMSNGVVVALLLGVGIVGVSSFVPAIADPIRLAATASAAVLLVIIIAASLGATIPLLLHRMKIDPALATGPFITTSNDIIGIVVFFLLVDRFYL